MTTLIEKKLRLTELARSQGGFFSASQAEKIGFNNANQFRMVKSGEWTRERRGIYRLSSEPESDRPDLHILSLFFRHRNGEPSGVFGLETAASIHEIGDFMPAKCYVLVSPRFQKTALVPSNVEVVEVPEIEKHIGLVGGLPVTSPIRTIVDLLLRVDRDPGEIRRAFLAARVDGIISSRMIREAKWIPKHLRAKISEWEREHESKK